MFAKLGRCCTSGKKFFALQVAKSFALLLIASVKPADLYSIDALSSTPQVFNIDIIIAEEMTGNIDNLAHKMLALNINAVLVVLYVQKNAFYPYTNSWSP